MKERADTEEEDPRLNPDVPALQVAPEQVEVHIQQQPHRRRKQVHLHSALMDQVGHLRHRLDTVRRNFALLLIYMTVFLDFIGITLLSPGMRFMIDPKDPGAFTDIRLPPECQEATDQMNSTSLAGCAGYTSMQPGTAISIMMFSYGIGQLFSTAIMGWSSDRFGPRLVLVISTGGSAVCFVLQGLVWSFWPHVATRFIGGLFGGSRPVCAAYIAQTVAPHERAKMMVLGMDSVNGA